MIGNNWTEDDIKTHLRKGWTVDELISVFDFKTGKEKETFDKYFVDEIREFVAQGNYPGNFTLHENILLPIVDDWGRRSWVTDPCDPVGFILDYKIVKNHLLHNHKAATSNVSVYDLDFVVLKLIWKPTYISAYRGLGYLDGRRDFLDTIYWNVIRQYLIHTREYCCQLCGKPGEIALPPVLEIHHNQYRVHGAEHLYLDTLSVLHRECHQRLHPVGSNAHADYW